MADFLLITDIPRIRKTFIRFAEDRGLPLRVASSLEKGGEELVAVKPAMVFVQTHLSGLSADILLMHLKKLLGKRRTRFVLLAPPDQISDGAIKLYHDYIDTSLDEQPLLAAINSTIAAVAPKRKKTGALPETATTAAGLPPTCDTVIVPPAEPPPESTINRSVDVPPPAEPLQEPEPQATNQVELADPSLEESGVVYAPKPQMSVYSEFTSAFESAVSEVSATEPAPVSRLEPPTVQEHLRTADIRSEPTQTSSKRATFIFWLIPLLLIVVVITLLQNYLSKPGPGATVSLSPQKPAEKPATATAIKPETAPKTELSATTPGKVAANPQTATANPNKDVAQTSSPAQRPATLPSFIPREGLDKTYGTANPGWERYMGAATEFKVYREGKSIKAIQAIDRGGKGIPEAFMKGALGQLTNSPSFAPTSTENKEEYLVQRAQLSENLSAVFYRDARGGSLRGFVVTWR